ncbi:hypothetical protein [Azospirillum doebereinerae]
MIKAVLCGVFSIIVVHLIPMNASYAKSCDGETSDAVFQHIRRFGYLCQKITSCDKSDLFPIWIVQCDGKSPIVNYFRIAQHNGRQKLKIDTQDICYALETGERLSGSECKY